MRMKPIAPNMTELYTDKATVLFSYRTPVAACLNDGSGFVRTADYYSKTTTRHINKWLAGAEARTIPQDELDTIAE